MGNAPRELLRRRIDLLQSVYVLSLQALSLHEPSEALEEVLRRRDQRIEELQQFVIPPQEALASHPDLRQSTEMLTKKNQAVHEQLMQHIENILQECKQRIESVERSQQLSEGTPQHSGTRFDRSV